MKRSCRKFNIKLEPPDVEICITLYSPDTPSHTKGLFIGIFMSIPRLLLPFALKLAEKRPESRV